MQKYLSLGRLGSLESLISPVGLVNYRSSRCLLGVQKKLSLRRTQGTKAIKRLCLNPSTLVALPLGLCVKWCHSFSFFRYGISSEALQNQP